MQRVGSREFKNRMGKYMRVVRKGQTLMVTDRGQVVAKITPPDEGGQQEATMETVLKKLEAAGQIRLARRPLGKFRAAKAKGKPASQIIIEDRR